MAAKVMALVVAVAMADTNPRCGEWAAEGECDKNPGWMVINCPRSCHACHLLDPKRRCDRARLNMSEVPALTEGDLGALFERIVADHGDEFDINILSRDPWVLTLDNFFDAEEAAALVGQVSGGFERSTDTGAYDKNGVARKVVSSGRTSQNAWCRDTCEADATVDKLQSRIERVLGIARDNFESFQVLRYLEGQYYRQHHDYGASQRNLACGPRILTFFLYLSDVDYGGETAFPKLDLAVKPKLGRALLWPSVRNDDPLAVDGRTTHEARAVGPVPEGVDSAAVEKLAANTWVHMYNFRTPNLWGCTGAFDELPAK